MNYHNITTCDMKNGEGLRVVLWCSYCPHHCKNCHNPQTWDVNSGVLFDDRARLELLKELENEYISGLTLSGGDPLANINGGDILDIVLEVKNKFPNKNIWCYTGYSWEEVKHLPHMEYIDVIVDGKYIEEKSKPSKNWVGSTNQRVIDVKESLKQNKVILWEES